MNACIDEYAVCQSFVSELMRHNKLKNALVQVQIPRLGLLYVSSHYPISEQDFSEASLWRLEHYPGGWKQHSGADWVTLPHKKSEMDSGLIHARLMLNGHPDQESIWQEHVNNSWRAHQLAFANTIAERQSRPVFNDLYPLRKNRFESLLSELNKRIVARDPYTHLHQHNVSRIAVWLGTEIGLYDDCLEYLRVGGLIHDIGKLLVPIDILKKPGRLTESEYAQMQLHLAKGEQLVQGVELPWRVKEMILQHHERMDGSGYPNGLSGHQICIEAKIIAVADVLDAMAAERPYRGPISLDEVIRYLVERRGTQFDEVVIDGLLSLYNSCDKLQVMYNAAHSNSDSSVM